jgi:threonine aldolase
MRSDTLTMPTPEMRRAMAEAELGDDVFGEDPTVNRLQEVAAERLGKEAALFVSSGTMGNLLGVLTLCRAGEEVITEASSHTFLYEAAGAARVGGVQIMPVPTADGVLTAEQIVERIRPDDPHHPRTAAVVFEDTHNRHGGVAWPLPALESASRAAHERGLAVHLDGARIFNAALASGAGVEQIAACADTVTFCVSKGLGAPAGSLFCGPAEKVHEAVRLRKMLGGGMREVGVLAAAGLYALEHMVDRLAEDHANARTLAEGLSELPGVAVDLERVQTNLVFLRLSSMPAGEFVAELRKQDVLAGATGPDSVRMVTHYGIEPADIQKALQACSEVLSAA